MRRARGLWNALPAGYQEQATFYTDLWEAYAVVFPASQHVPSGKGSGFAAYIERFNCTLRQRASRLVRKALSFSKKTGKSHRRHQALYLRLQRHAQCHQM